MGNLFKGVHLLTQSEYNILSENEQLDPDVLYATPENVTELVRLHTEQISENSTNIARNREDIESLKKSPGGSSEDIVEIKNTINEIILRDSTQDNRLLNIEEKFATDVVDLASTQTVTGPKTFTEHIYLANADGTVDRISHLNNNFIIHSGATNSAVLNIDEGLEKIYAFNKELAFKEDIMNSGAMSVVDNTAVYVDGEIIDVFYDMDDNSKNLGYPNGIVGGTTISTPSFSNYKMIRIYGNYKKRNQLFAVVNLTKANDEGDYVGANMQPTFESNDTDAVWMGGVVTSGKGQFAVTFGNFSTTKVIDNANGYVYKIEGVY